MFRITKYFYAGPLKGLTISETTSVMFKVGTRVDRGYGSSPYEITEVTRL